MTGPDLREEKENVGRRRMLKKKKVFVTQSAFIPAVLFYWDRKKKQKTQPVLAL